MSVGFPSSIKHAVWSPCNRFIAIVWDGSGDERSVEILDAVTLGQLSTFPVDGMIQHLIFSPDSHSLTWYNCLPYRIISWDIHTGVLISKITLKQLYSSDIIYSTCGTMVAVFCYKHGGITISTYNIISGTYIYSCSVNIQNLAGVWAHGECLRFAAKELGTLTIWEVGFTPAHIPIKVESLSIPYEIHSHQSSYNHTLSRLISKGFNTVCVWDTEHSKYLLGSMNIMDDSKIYTSSHSSFFVEGDSGVELWKESPNGYTLHQRFISSTSDITPCISPNGELVLTFGGSVVQLWYTTNSNTPLPTTPTQPFQKYRRSSLLEFAPDEALAAVIQRGDKVVTVLDLKSGIQRLTIDAGMAVCGLGMTGSTIVVVGHGKIVTWSLPARGCVLNSRVHIGDSVKITTLDQLRVYSKHPLVLVSPDLQYVVFAS